MLLSVTSLAGTAIATTAEECQAKIDALTGQTADATFFGQSAEKNSTRLQDKLAAASAKLAEDKFADTIEKVSDFRATVDALNTAPKLKIHPDDAAVLIGGANDVIACLENVATP